MNRPTTLCILATLVFTFGVATVAASETLIACDGSRIDPANLAGAETLTPIDAPASGGPVPVDIQMEITELRDIDPISSSFRFEGYGDFRFCDPRSAFDPQAEGVSVKRFLGTQAEVPVWNIGLHIANGIGSVETTQRLVEIEANGSIRLSGYFNSKVSTNFDLRDFPLDRHALEIRIEPFNYGSDAVQLVSSDRHVGISDEIKLPEWQITGLRASVDEHSKFREKKLYSRAVVSIDIAREWGFYLYKLWAPLTLIVCLSWSVFYMPDESLAGRIRISATAFLTVVAYQFAVAGNLPKVGYLTLMDRLMIGSFVLIALTALESLAYASLLRRNPERARRLDRTCRWLFPCAYVGGIGMMWLRYTL